VHSFIKSTSSLGDSHFLSPLALALPMAVLMLLVLLPSKRLKPHLDGRKRGEGVVKLPAESPQQLHLDKRRQIGD
jgi:hypothetical protein